VRVNVADLLVDRDTTRKLAFSERLEPLADDVTLPQPVEGTFVLSGTGQTVRCVGRVRTVAEMVCGACLVRYPQPLEIAVNEEFCPPGPTASARDESRMREDLGPEDFLTPLEQGEMLNLTEIVRQHLVLALPIAPRCREDCRGLCPHCGADRNSGACQCEDREVDPRLEPLRQWAARMRPGAKRRGPSRTTRTGRRRPASGE
jgi:uncharacterized protein